MPYRDDDELITPPPGRSGAPVARLGGAGDAPVGGTVKPRGTMGRRVLGVMEAALPVAETLNELSPAQLIPGFHEREKAARERSRARVEQAHEAGVTGDPWTRFATQVGVGVPMAMITKNPAAAAGLEGYATSESPDLSGRALDTGIAALGGHYLNKAAQGVANLAEPLIEPAVRTLQRAGVRLTPGQVFGGERKAAEDAAMSQPVVSQKIIRDRNQSLRDFDRGAANRALMPVGITLPEHVRTGHDAVAFLENEATRRYQSILPRLRMQVDNRLTAGLSRAHQIIAGTDQATIDQFNNIMRRNMLFNGQGQSYGRPLVQMIRDTRSAAYDFLKSDSANERTLGEALAAVDEGIRGSLRAQNPHLAGQLRATDRLYRGTRIVSDAASRATEGISGVGQLAQAVRRADPTKGARATGMGRAYMQDYSNAGAQVIPSQLRDSGTAARIMATRPIEAAKGALAGLKYDVNKALLPFTSRQAGPVGQRIARAIRQNPSLAAVTGIPGAQGLLALLDEGDEE